MTELSGSPAIGQMQARWASGVVLALLAPVVAAMAAAGRAGSVSVLLAVGVYSGIALLVLRGYGALAASSPFGAANFITLVRAGFAALLCGLAGEALATGGGLAAERPEAAGFWGWMLPLGGALALILDGLDGWIARRMRQESAFGARFDMEVDALFILALATVTLTTGRAGAWILLAGLLRYAFLAVGWIWPALAAPLPPSLRRKAACVLMGIALVGALIPMLPAAGAGILAGAGVLAIVWSFAVDTLWLLRQRDGAVVDKYVTCEEHGRMANRFNGVGHVEE